MSAYRRKSRLQRLCYFSRILVFASGVFQVQFQPVLLKLFVWRRSYALDGSRRKPNDNRSANGLAQFVPLMVLQGVVARECVALRSTPVQAETVT